jgi:hypothetical protein
LTTQTENSPNLKVAAIRWRPFVTGRRRVSVFVAIGIVLVGGVMAWSRYQARPRLGTAPGRFPQSTAAERSPGHLRVLFLGNSLTEYNGGLALTMQQLAASAGKNPMPIFDEVTKFGATWAQLWDVTQARGMIEQGNWDYIVLQDYSTAPFIYRSEMDVYAKRFSEAARAVGAEPVFFMTWPHDDELFTQHAIAAAYMNVADANHAMIAPVGLVWQKVLRDHPYLPLYDPRDNPRKHPTGAGTYLTACVFYSMFFHESPRGLTGRIAEGKNVYVDLSPIAALELQDAAWAMVKRSATTRPAKDSDPYSP